MTDTDLNEAMAAATTWLTEAEKQGWRDDDVIHSFGVTTYGDRPAAITVADLHTLVSAVHIIREIIADWRTDQ